MRLYISNFSKKFIFKAFFCSICILLFYFVIAQSLNLIFEVKGPNQWLNNVIKAQNYIYSSTPYNIVIVGSSMAYNIPSKTFTDSCFNLAFAGGSALTGLNILVNQNSKTPNIVIIEANGTIYRSADTEFLEQCYKPYLPYLPFLLKQYRPDVVLYNTIIMLKKSALGERVPIDPSEPSRIALEIHQQDYMNNVDLLNINNNLDEMKILIKKLEDRGVKIIFIEPPIHVSLLNKPGYTDVKKEFLNRFPPEKYHWIENDNLGNYKTTDGIHLARNSAQKYGEYLNQTIRQLYK